MKIKKINHLIYGDMCTAVFLFCHEFGKKISIEKEINKSEVLKKWSKIATKTVMKEL